MTSSLLAKKARLVQEVAGRLSEHLDPAYRDSLARCLSRLDLLSLRYLGSQNHRIHRVPQQVALVGESVRPFGWAVWLSILTDAKLDDPDWILGGLLKGSEGWGFSPEEARRWRSEYLRAHLTPLTPARPEPSRVAEAALFPAAPRSSGSPLQKIG